MKRIIAALFLTTFSAFADNADLTKAISAAIEQTGIPGAAVVVVGKQGVI